VAALTVENSLQRSADSRGVGAGTPPAWWNAALERPLLALSIVLGGLLLLRLVALRLNATDLFFDEAQYWFWSTEPAFGYYSKPPLIAWLIGLSTSVCGTNEACIRLPAPLLHTATAVALYVLGRRLYDVGVGLIAGMTYATLPAVSLSSGIISTDVPLLFCWAIALIGFTALLDTKGWWPALLLGAGIGLGLNAKYAMAWFVPCAAIYLAVTPLHRGIVRDRRLWTALAIGIALILPNLAWNLSNSFATFSHTADNAKWSGSLVNPLKALEFIGAQFGVFGPILFVGLLAATWRAWRNGAPQQDRLLLAFALPVLVAITIQALLSRAHANWAAVSYVAATVLMAAVLLRDAPARWLTASFSIHVAAMGLIVVASAIAGRVAIPGIGDPFARTLGWHAVSDVTREELERARRAGTPYGSVITGDRSVSAELLYYMRGEPTPVLAWREGSKPQDHFELTRPFAKGAAEPVLLVDLTCDINAKAACFAASGPDPDGARRFSGRFERVAPVAHHLLPAGQTRSRRITLYALHGYRAK
jgi:4-amino-4-deoxy-L-arabinose transferase-like glycosyltransferase